MKKFAALFLALVLLLTLFAGCSGKNSGKDKKDNTLEGTYHLETVKGQSPAEFFKSSDEDAQQTNSYYHLDELSEKSLNNLATLIVKEDGTWELSYAEDAIKSDSGVWEKEEDGRICFSQHVGRIFYAEFKNGTLTFDEGLHKLHDMKLVYGK